MSTTRQLCRSEHNQRRIDGRKQAGLRHLARMLKAQAARDEDAKLAGTESDEVIVSPGGIVVPKVTPEPLKYPYHLELLAVLVSAVGRGRRRREGKPEPTTDRTVIAYERPKSRSKYEPHIGKKQKAKHEFSTLPLIGRAAKKLARLFSP